MKKRFTRILAALALLAFMTPSMAGWGQTTQLFHETFGNNTGSAREWNDSYSVKSGIATVYSDVAYTMTNLKQSKNTMGYVQSGLMQTSTESDAVFEFGPLHVADYTNISLDYYWKAASIKATYSTSIYYKTSVSGSYTEIEHSAQGATTFVEVNVNLPVAAQTNTLYLKIVWNTSNTQALIDEVELRGEANSQSSDPILTIVNPTGGTVAVSSNGVNVSSGNQIAAGTSLTLSNTPEAAYSFGSYSVYETGNETNTVTVTNGSFDMPDFDVTVSAVFNPKPTHTITLAQVSNGTISSDPQGSAYEGQTVTLTASVNSGYEFDTWNVTGATVADVTSATTTFVMGTENVTVSATFAVSPYVVDVLNRDFTGVSGTSYSDWSDKQGTSGAVYAGNSAGGNSAIQLRSTNPSGIVTTTSNGLVKKVVVTWESHTATGRTLDVYGSNTAYTSPAQLYNEETRGTWIGSIVCGSSTQLAIGDEDEYEYIGIRSNDGAMYLDEIRISWEVSNDPACTVSPDIYDFENVAIGSTATQSFTVYTANLTGDLTLSMSNSVFTVAPTTIEQNASSTQVTITFAPTNAGGADASLIVNGSGFTNEVVALVSGTGASVRTITFNAGNGTCETQTMSGVDGATINLPTATPSTACDAAGWTFAGWSAINVEETTNAPELVPSEYTINGDATLYAVYNLIEASTTQNTEFNFEAIATANSWEDGHAYTPVNIDPITITANGGGNNGKYYVSDKTWRMYNGGSVTITAADGKSITAVTSTPSTSFTINTDGTASQSFTATVKFKSITVTYSNGPATVTYATSPACLESVATPTFSPEDGTIFYEDELEVTISCTTEDATIYYTLDGSVPTNESSVYNGTITLTETTTVKAIAMKEGMADSEIAEATYTQLSLSTIAEVRAQGTGSVITKGIVTHMSGVTAYIQDETAAIVVYGSDVPTVGDEIRVSGTLTSYKGLLEIGSSSNPPTITVLSQGNTVDPTVMTIEAINEDFEGNNAYQAKLVRIENAIYNDGVVSQDNNSITVYGTMSGVSNGTIVSFTGNIGCYNDVQIVNPTDIIASYPLTINGYTDVTEGNNNKGYYLIASPVTVDLTNHDMTDGDFDLYYFDESQELEWRNYEDTPFNLVPGKGYLYAKKGEGQTYNFTLTGAPYNNQPITLSKSESGDFAGLNLIGNPYATAATVSAESFYRMNPEGRADLIEGSGSVDAMEGIFVIAENDGEEVTFTPSTSSKSFEQVAINLLKNRGNVIDRAVVRFGEGRQLPKFQLNPRNTKIYVTEGNKDYAVVRSAAEAEMPVSFRASENGTYTLAVEAENVEMNYLHLIDNLTGMDVDLLQTPSYTFDAKTSDYASRFRLVFKANGTNENNAETFAYFNGTNWTVSNVGDATLQVVDVTGRTVANQMINGNAELNLNQPAGVYVIRLVNGDNVKTQKVVVR